MTDIQRIYLYVAIRGLMVLILYGLFFLGLYSATMLADIHHWTDTSIELLLFRIVGVVLGIYSLKLLAKTYRDAFSR